MTFIASCPQPVPPPVFLCKVLWGSPEVNFKDHFKDRFRHRAAARRRVWTAAGILESWTSGILEYWSSGLRCLVFRVMQI